jgi:hypothetical protein
VGLRAGTAGRQGPEILAGYAAVFLLWRRSEGTLSIHSIVATR